MSVSNKMIYEPAEDSYLLADAVKKFAKGTVLDVGTGSGIQAKTAASLKKVKTVLAVDINNAAVTALAKKIKKEKLKKIKAARSDLFSNVKGRFDTLIFNPPYLPLDEREPHDSRLATTGGKHGYELLQKFLVSVNQYLAKNGIGLILFSSLTKKEKVDEILDDIGYDYELVSEQHVSFETLYVYAIRRNWLLNELFDKNVSSVQKLMKGHRGVIFTGMYKKRKVAIKAQRSDVDIQTIEREADMIKKLNAKGIAPKLFLKGKNYFIYVFAEGEFIKEFLEHSTKQETKRVLLETLRQCRVLDLMHVTKEEMHNPWKHVIVGKKVVLVDFERAHYDRYPQNVTQFCQYIMRNADTLAKKKMPINKTEIIVLAQEYKRNQSMKNYDAIKKLLSSC